MSEFLETMKSADSGHAWRVLDEFMDALKESKTGNVFRIDARFKKN